MSDSVTPWTVACQAPLSFTVFWSLLKFMSIESVTPSYHLILCCPLLLLPSIFPSIRVFSNESSLWSRQSTEASVSVLPMNVQGWFPLALTCLISLLSKGLAKGVFSGTTIWKHHFFSTQSSLWSNSHIQVVSLGGGENTSRGAMLGRLGSKKEHYQARSCGPQSCLMKNILEQNFWILENEYFSVIPVREDGIVSSERIGVPTGSWARRIQ